MNQGVECFGVFSLEYHHAWPWTIIISFHRGIFIQFVVFLSDFHTACRYLMFGTKKKKTGQTFVTEKRLIVNI
jgi:hypothetical protein